MQREGYWDYMGRKLREDHIQVGEDIMKREIAEMQKQVHFLMIRIKVLTDHVNNLEYKVKIQGGNPNQMEFMF